MQKSLQIVERLRHSWRNAWHFSYRGWNFFEAVVYDETGQSYLVSAGAMGNKYLYLSTAWVATNGRWHFLNKNFFTQVCHTKDGWRTSDGQLDSFFDPECGYELLVQSGDQEIALRFIPNPDFYHCDSVTHKQTHFELFLYNHCQVRGYLTLNKEKKAVKGIGSVEHFYGRFAEKLYWHYFSLKSPDLSVYFRTSRNEEDFLSKAAIIYTPTQAYNLLGAQTNWETQAPDKILVTASQPGLNLAVNLDLALSNPENEKQPYINFHLPPFKEIYANIFEHCAHLEGYYQIGDEQKNFSGEGICHLTEAVW